MCCNCNNTHMWRLSSTRVHFTVLCNDFLPVPCSLAVEEKHRKFSCAMDGWSVIKLLPGLPGLPWCPGYGIGRKSEGQICGLF